jgi:hypothetical protein
MTPKLSSFEEFWPFYVSQHMNPTCRALHFVGTALVVGFLALAVLVSPYWFFATFVAGYGCAWVGHFAFERNRPATFTYPLWSLRGDFRMFRLMLLGRMGPELERAERSFPAPSSS